LWAAEFLRRQRHDFLNDLQVIRGYIQLGRPERALAHIDETLEDLAPQHEISRIADGTLQALILCWYLDLRARGLTVAVQVAEEFCRPAPVLGDAEQAAAFYAFICDCGAAEGFGAAAAEKNAGAVALELLPQRQGLAGSCTFRREGEPQREFFFSP
jgi:sensor histidine kinase regulating citrate/malate metabolism